MANNSDQSELIKLMFKSLQIAQYANKALLEDSSMPKVKYTARSFSLLSSSHANCELAINKAKQLVGEDKLF